MKNERGSAQGIILHTHRGVCALPWGRGSGRHREEVGGGEDARAEVVGSRTVAPAPPPALGHVHAPLQLLCTQ